METAREAVAIGDDPTRIAAELVEKLRAPDLRLALVFSDARLDPYVIAGATARGLAPARMVGCTTRGIVARAEGHARTREPAAVALGLYGDWLRVGIGVAANLSHSGLGHARDAMHAAASEIGIPATELEPGKHVGVTFVDGRCGHEEAFCIGTAAAAVQIRVIGGCSSADIISTTPTPVFVDGAALSDAGVVVLLASERPLRVVTSAHLVPTDIRTVVTAATGRYLDELDGFPAARRFAQLVAALGERADDSYPTEFAFGRYLDGVPYVRSIIGVEGDRLTLAGNVEPGHVLRVMRPGDLVGQTRADLAAAAAAVGGTVSSLLAFSCVGRHLEATGRRLEDALAAEYAAYPVVGLQTFGEQIGMVLVNHTLTGLVIG